MGEEPVVDTVSENAVEEHCQPARSLDHPVVNLTQIVDVQPSIDDGVTVVPPEPPDLSPGPAHKVSISVAFFTVFSEPSFPFIPPFALLLLFFYLYTVGL